MTIGLSALFGPVSSKESDVALLYLINLNSFLRYLQLGLYMAAGLPVLYAVFGDSPFAFYSEGILYYYQRSNAEVPLTDNQNCVNFLLKRAGITIEKNYGQLGN